MKKITLKSVALLCALVFALSCLTACGGSKDKQSATIETTTEAPTVKTLESWWNENASDAEEAFTALEAMGVTISVKENTMTFAMDVEKLVDETTLKSLENIDRETLKQTFESQMDSLTTSVKPSYESIKSDAELTDIKLVIDIYYDGELLCSAEVTE